MKYIILSTLETTEYDCEIVADCPLKAEFVVGSEGTDEGHDKAFYGCKPHSEQLVAGEIEPELELIGEIENA